MSVWGRNFSSLVFRFLGTVYLRLLAPLQTSTILTASRRCRRHLSNPPGNGQLCSAFLATRGKSWRNVPSVTDRQEYVSGATFKRLYVHGPYSAAFPDKLDLIVGMPVRSQTPTCYLVNTCGKMRYMPAGLHLIFDKSALQSFSLDETNWLDHFYSSVITPLFFAEVLADLEKEVGTGKTPEQVFSFHSIKYL